MALTTAKVSEMPFHSPLPLCCRPSLPLSLLRRRFSLLFSASASASSSSSSSSLRTANPTANPNAPRKLSWDEDQKPSPRKSKPHSSAPWLQHWAPPRPASPAPAPEPRISGAGAGLERPDGSGAIERIVHRLRNLGLGLDGEEVEVEEEEYGVDRMPLDGDESLGELLARSWNRPGLPEVDKTVLPWERDESDYAFLEDCDNSGMKRRRVKAPTLAELTIEDVELRRLRRMGMALRERITVPKAGVTQAITEKIHDAWHKSELVRLKFHETLAHDMKTAHELVERRTGGLVIWRSGSVMVVYRGSNYKRPSKSKSSSGESIPIDIAHEGDKVFIPDVSGAAKLTVVHDDHAISSTSEYTKPIPLSVACDESMTEEEGEYNSLLDGMGPRFVDWWGTGILPVDADLLPQKIPGYRTPFRLLPTGMRSRLTNSEMTNLRKLARSLPCHFALGRNRNHQGLAAAILKLWEKSLVVKIAVKRGIQNTNNKLMAEELKKLTGGILLLRNKYYIVIYRGKDFLPPNVATALAEREELTKDNQAVEEKARTTLIRESHTQSVEGCAFAGTLAEFQEAQARWRRNISAEEYEKMKEEASKSEAVKQFKRIEHKLYVSQAKKMRAERLLAKIEASMVPVTPSDDQETLTDEERSVYRRIGLRMKAYLPLGIRGVFDGVIENMHLHWKHRELVKLISKQKTLSFVEDTARLLEYESGGILVAIERVPKGFALIYYRGKNYQRPINLRPRNLLTKAKALKRSIAIQRHEALSQHITELERTIEQMKSDLGITEVEERLDGNTSHIQFVHTSHSNQIEDEYSSVESEEDNDYNSDNYDSDYDTTSEL